jgi:hypothetical protein
MGMSCTENSNSIKNDRELHLKSDLVSENERIAFPNSYRIEYNPNELENYNLFTDAQNSYDLDIKVENNKVLLYYVPKSPWKKSSKSLNEKYKDTLFQSSLGPNLQSSGAINKLYGFD